MFLYEIGPVDYWDGTVTLHSYLQNLQDTEGEARVNQELIRLTWAMAKLFECSYWEGDIREGVNVFSLPPADGDCSMQTGFIFKQDNNGQTFIVSPRALPWLHERRVNKRLPS